MTSPRSIMLAVAVLAAAQLSAAERLIRIAVIIPPSPSITAGVRAAAEEGRRTATLLGRDLEVEVAEVSTAAQAAVAARRAGDAGATAIVGGGSPAIADAIAGAASSPFLSIERSDQADRDGRYRLTPTRAQIEKVVGTRKGTRAVAWHPDLARYGAGELNERFHAATGRPMDSDAWTAWLAVKFVVEAALRDREIASMRIDGHKGVPLRFDGNRVLQQPLYVVNEKGELVDD